MSCPVSGHKRKLDTDATDETAYYKNRNNHLVDLKDKVVGQCFPVPTGYQFTCPGNGFTNDFGDTNDISTVSMTSFFLCNSTVW